MLREIIRADKTIVEMGQWKFGVKMPRSAFPLSKQRKFEIRGKYRWHLTRFDSLGASFRLLIAYRTDLQVYVSYLGRDEGSDTTVIGRYEYHPSHGGWHYHANCGTRPLVSGRTGLEDRLPTSRSRHRRMEFDATMNDDKALHIGHKAFGLVPRIQYAQ